MQRYSHEARTSSGPPSAVHGLRVMGGSLDLVALGPVIGTKPTSGGPTFMAACVPEVDVVWHGRSRSRPAPSKPTTLTFIARRGMGGRYVELWGETDAH